MRPVEAHTFAGLDSSGLSFATVYGHLKGEIERSQGTERAGGICGFRAVGPLLQTPDDAVRGER